MKAATWDRPHWIGAQPAFDNPGNLGINYVTRDSGWFIPPATDKYVFFVATDDDSDLWLSTDSTMAKKQVIAQEESWSPYDSWLTSGDGAATWPRKNAPTSGPSTPRA